MPRLRAPNDPLTAHAASERHALQTRRIAEEAARHGIFGTPQQHVEHKTEDGAEAGDEPGAGAAAATEPAAKRARPAGAGAASWALVEMGAGSAELSATIARYARQQQLHASVHSSLTCEARSAAVCAARGRTL